MWVSQEEFEALPLAVQEAIRTRFWFEEEGYLAPRGGFFFSLNGVDSSIQFSFHKNRSC